MNRYQSIRTLFNLFLSTIVFLSLLVSISAGAAAEFQLIKSMGKLEGTPYAKLIQDSAGNLYGTTYYGGSIGAGTVYKLTPAGDFSVLHAFDGDNGGAKPHAGLILANGGNNPTGTVKFLDGNKSLGSVSLSSGVAKLSTSRLKLGSHSITAVYSGDDNNASSTSAPVVQVVQAVTRIGLKFKPMKASVGEPLL